MNYRRRIYYSAAQRAEIWDRWQRGESMSSIGRAFDRQSSSVFSVISPTGGILWGRWQVGICLFHQTVGPVRDCFGVFLRPRNAHSKTGEAHVQSAASIIMTLSSNARENFSCEDA